MNSCQRCRVRDSASGGTVKCLGVIILSVSVAEQNAQGTGPLFTSPITARDLKVPRTRCVDLVHALARPRISRQAFRQSRATTAAYPVPAFEQSPEHRSLVIERHHTAIFRRYIKLLLYPNSAAQLMKRAGKPRNVCSCPLKRHEGVSGERRLAPHAGFPATSQRPRPARDCGQRPKK